MAGGTLFEGIIGINVEDNDAPGQLRAIIGRLEQAMQAAGDMPGVNLGAKLTTGLTEGLATVDATIGQIKGAVGALQESMAALGIESKGIGAVGDNAALLELKNTTAAAQRLIVVLQELRAVSGNIPLNEGLTGGSRLAYTSQTPPPPVAVAPVAPASIAAQEAEVQAIVAQAAAVEAATPVVEAQVEVQKQTLSAEEQARTAASNRAIKEEQIATMMAETSRRQLLAGTPEQFQQGIGIDPNGSAKARIQQFDVQQAQIAEGRAQMGLEAAAKELPLVNLTTEQEGALAKLTEQRAKTVRSLLVATEKLAAITQAEAAQAEVAGAGSGGVLGGGGGKGGSSLLESAGTTLKYFALYQAFSTLQRGVEGLISTTEEYSLAVNQLSIALGVSHDEATQAAQGYATIGQNLATAPAVAINAASQYTRFFQDTSGASGNVGAQLGSTVNLLESRSAKDGEEEALVKKRLDEVGAIAQNYGLGAQGASDLYGAATIIAQHYGQQMGGSLLGGTAQIADLLKQSGFSPEQGLSLVGAVTQYTGATSEAAAGDLKRLLGRSGSNTFQNLFSEYGVNTNQNVKGELAQLSIKFQDLDSTQQDSIITKLGGGRAGAAALALIKNFGTIDATAQKGADSPNAADDQAKKKLDTFAGQIELIRADLVALAKDLSETGLGGVFGLLLKSVDPLIRGLDVLLKGLNAIPAAAVAGAGGIALATIAYRNPEGVTGVLNKIGRVGTAATDTPEIAATKAATVATEQLTVALIANAEASGAAATVLTGSATEAAAAEAALAETQTVAAAAAATAAADGAAMAAAYVATAEAEVVATRAAVAKAEATLANVTGEASLSAATADLVVAQEAAVAAALELATVSAELVVAQEAATVGAQGLVVAEAEVGGLGLALGGLGAAALAAAGTLVPLVAIIGALMLAGEVKKSTDAISLGGQEGASAFKEADKAVKTGDIAGVKSSIGVLDKASKDVVPSGIGGELALGATGISDLLSGHGYDTSTKVLVAARDHILARQAELKRYLKQLEATAAAATGDSAGSAFFGADYQNIDSGIRQMGANKLSASGSANQLMNLLNHTNPSDDVQVAGELTPISGNKGIADELKRLISQAGKSRNPMDQEKQLAALLPLVAKVQQIAGAATGSGAADFVSAADGIADQVNKPFYDLVVKTANDRIASIKAFEGNNSKSQAEIRSVLTKSLLTTAAGGDVNSTIALIGVMDKKFLDQFNANISAERAILEQQAVGIRAAEAAATAALTSEVPGNYNDRQVQAIKTRDAAAKNSAAIAGKKTIQGTIADATPYAAPTGSAFAFPKDAAAKGPTAQDIELARLQSLVIPGDPMSAAQTALAVANYQLRTAKDQVAYYGAVKALHEAQYQYAQVALSQTNTSDLLGIDRTNPLLMAQEKVREAARQLIMDRNRGVGSGVIAKDQLALKDAQSAAEKTGFDQKFADEKTNYDLQRISLSAYLSYLHAQHNYLTSVHSKTRQQVDELNQVDQALQGLTKGLDGQFNLGAIKVPSPYEVRRAVAAGGSSSVSATTNVVSISINGADMAAVRALLAGYLGHAVMSTAGSAPRKV